MAICYSPFQSPTCFNECVFLIGKNQFMHSVETMGCSGMIFSWAHIRTMQKFLLLQKAIGNNCNVLLLFTIQKLILRGLISK